MHPGRNLGRYRWGDSLDSAPGVFAYMDENVRTQHLSKGGEEFFFTNSPVAVLVDGFDGFEALFLCNGDAYLQRPEKVVKELCHFPHVERTVVVSIIAVKNRLDIVS
jgi:hypothetical protein